MVIQWKRTKDETWKNNKNKRTEQRTYEQDTDRRNAYKWMKNQKAPEENNFQMSTVVMKQNFWFQVNIFKYFEHK